MGFKALYDGDSEADMMILIGDLNDWSNNYIKEVIGAVEEALYEATPVLTGFAQSNWIASNGTPFTGTVGSKNPDHRSGNIDSGAALASVQGLAGGAGEVKDVFIANNVLYIGPLDEGWSKQAPPGFAEAAVIGVMDGFADPSVTI
jgi:hypothetical protein